MNSKILSRIIAILLFIAVMAGTWDAWWHGAIGRDTLWEPPHIALYSAVILAIILGIYGWQQTKEKVWKRLAILLVLVPVSAPFDELWHRIFGVEDLSSPLIVWSPPHVVLILAIIGSLIFLLPIIKKDKDVFARTLFSSIIFASILSLAFFLFAPIQPTGPWELLGFWGAGIIAALFIGILLFAQRWSPSIATATLVIVFLLVISSVGFSRGFAPDVKIEPHDHPPTWLTVFSFLIPAAFLDITKKSNILMRGALAGLLWSGLLYGFSSIFFKPEFQYTLANAGVAIVSSILGGIIVAIIIKKNKKSLFNH